MGKKKSIKAKAEITEESGVKGFKVFDENWKCHDFQYKLSVMSKAKKTLLFLGDVVILYASLAVAVFSLPFLLHLPQPPWHPRPGRAKEWPGTPGDGAAGE